MNRTGSVLTGLTLLFGLGLGVCLSAVEKLKNAAIALQRAGEPISVSGLLPVISVFDYCLVAICLGLLTWLAWGEFRDRSISTMLMSLRPAPTFLLLGLIMVWTGQAYLYPGVLLGGDTGGHIARFGEFGQAIGAGAFPHWTNFHYLGSPLFGFTGPLTYMIGGALQALIGDALVTSKLFLFVTHILAGLVFYLFARRLEFPRLPALVAAIGFGGAFAILHLFLYRGVFPQALTVIFMVTLYFAAEGLMGNARHRWREILIFAFSTAGLIVNHQPHALFIALYLAIFGGMSVVLGRWRLAGLPYLLGAGIAGVLISLPAVIPIIVEAGWVMIAPGKEFFGLQLPTGERLANLVSWSNTRTTWERDYWAYLGWGSMGLGLIGIAATLGRRMTDAHFRLLLALLPGFFLMFFLHNSVVRDVMFIQFYLAIFAALGMSFLVQNVVAGRSRLVLAATLIVIVDVALTGLQPVARSDKAFMLEAGRYLAETAPEERIVEFDISADGVSTVNMGPSGGPISFDSMVQRISGHHNMAATVAHNYLAVALKRAEADILQSGRLTAETRTLLEIFNASRVICFSPAQAGCTSGFSDTVMDGPLAEIIRLSGASPVIFSGKLIELGPGLPSDKPLLSESMFELEEKAGFIGAADTYIANYLSRGGFDTAARRAAAIPLRVKASGYPAYDQADWQPVLADYKVALQSVQAVIDTNGPGYVQLSHAYFPGNAVSVNGSLVEPLQGALNLMVLPLAAGRNVIEIVPMMTDIRRLTFWISGCAILLLLVAMGFLARTADTRTL